MTLPNSKRKSKTSFAAMTLFIILIAIVLISLPLAVATPAQNQRDSQNSQKFSFEKIKQQIKSQNYQERFRVREELREKFLGEETFRAELKNRIRNCINNESEECQTIRETVEEVGKGVMNRACNNYENILEREKEKINKNQKLSDEEKEVLKEAIDEEANKFQNLCSRIENATTDELREIAKEMRELTKETKLKFGMAKGLVQIRRIGLVIERAEKLETKLQNFIEKNNVTNCGIENLTQEFNAKITEARTAYNESIDFWQQFKESIKNKEPKIELLREAQTKTQLAQLKLKEAHLILKEIIIKLRECQQIERLEVNETQ